MPNVDINTNSNAASDIESAVGLIANIVNQYIVTPESAPPGISGFVFDILDDEETIIDSDITDHFVEKNFAIQDHWAQKPLRFTLKGFVGEINDILQIEAQNAISVVEALVPVVDLLPEWNKQDAQVYQNISDINTNAQRAIGQVTSLSSLVNQFTVNQTRQQSAYNKLFSFWSNRQICTIQTPYGLLRSMAIESIHALQSGASRYISDFTVSFKEIKVVSTFIIPGPSSPNANGSGTTQVTPSNANQGSAKPPNTTTTPPPSLPIPNQTSEKGRVANMITPVTDLGNSAGVSLIPNTNPPIPVDIPNIFPAHNPVFATMPSQNMLMPGFIPGIG